MAVAFDGAHGANLTGVPKIRGHSQMSVFVVQRERVGSLERAETQESGSFGGGIPSGCNHFGNGHVDRIRTHIASLSWSRRISEEYASTQMPLCFISYQ